jgi:hypothetical protein
MISQLKKNKIVEVINLTEDLEILKHHLKNVYKDLYHIIITTPNSFSEINRLKKICSEWIDKITIIETDNNDTWLSVNSQSLFDIFSELLLDFEDIICFSEASEVPDFRIFEKVSEHLKFEPVILRMTDFVFNTKIYCKNRHMGSICVSYSNLLKNNNLVTEIRQVKKNIIGDSFYVVDNGNNFSFFLEKSKILDYFHTKNLDVDENEFDNCISNNFHPNFFENKKKSYFTDYEGDISFDVSNLKEFFFHENTEKKILIILNVYQKKVLSEWCEPYQRVLNFNFTEDYRFSELSLENNLETYNIFLPKYQLYQRNNLEDFWITYKVNELKRLLKNSNLMNNRLVDLIVFKDDIESESKMTFSFEELKKFSFENVFTEIF